MLQQHSHLEKRFKDNIQQVWGNQEELKGGMDAAEFNLRAHQKVLNAMAIELEKLVTRLNEEVFKDEHKITVLEMTDVTLPEEDGKAQVVRRLDWPYYHKQVEYDLKVLAELERQRAEEQKARQEAIFKAVDKLRETCSEESLEDLSKRIGEGENILKDDNLQEFELSEQERAAVAARLKEPMPEEPETVPEESPVVEEEAEMPPPQDEDIPEGASVFGG